MRDIPQSDSCAPIATNVTNVPALETPALLRRRVSAMGPKAAEWIMPDCRSAGRPVDVSCGDSARWLDQFTATFYVTTDDEYVHLSLVSGHTELDFGARRHNYLLLILARQRLRDAQLGTPDSRSGWFDLDRWSHDPSMSPERMNLSIFRIRRQFLKHGIVNAQNVIERRVPTRQIRLGAIGVRIVTI